MKNPGPVTRSLRGRSGRETVRPEDKARMPSEMRWGLPRTDSPGGMVFASVSEALTSPLDESRGFFLTEKTFCFDGPASIIYMLRSRGRPKSYVSSVGTRTIRRNFCVLCSRQPGRHEILKSKLCHTLVIGMTSNVVSR